MRSTIRTLRTFVAVPLPSDITEELAQIQRELKRAVPAQSVKWVNPPSIHITLRFLGDIVPDRVDIIKRALGAVARNVPRFVYDVGDIGAFPNQKRPRVIWIGIQDPAGWLSLLHSAVEESMESIGFEKEKRRFSPHLTLGRVRRSTRTADARAIGEALDQMVVPHIGRATAEEFVFFQSLLRPTGADYNPLTTYSLH